MPYVTESPILLAEGLTPKSKTILVFNVLIQNIPQIVHLVLLSCPNYSKKLKKISACAFFVNMLADRQHRKNKTNKQPNMDENMTFAVPLR